MLLQENWQREVYRLIREEILLDLPQRTAIKKVLDADSIAIIQGPPGTGKTNVIIEIILQILKSNKQNPDVEPKKVLLVSQSHPAVDKMLEDLIRESTAHRKG
jgi:superfamily I DNA and/or RNA helicase